MVPTVWVLQELRLFKTMPGLILIEVAFGLAFCVLLFRAFISSIPKELDEAAIIDGAGPIRLFFTVIFPLLRPVIVTVIVVQSVFVFNDFANPLYFFPGDENATVQLTLYNFKSQFTTAYNLLFMNILLITIPPLITYLFFQRQIVAGMTAGASRADPRHPHRRDDMPVHWSASMISPTEDVGSAPPLRGEVRLETGHGAVASAELHVSALGVFEASVNGRPVDDDVLSPGWSSYEWRLRYRTYDVARCSLDESVLDIVVGNGWYRGRLGLDRRRARSTATGSARIAQLEVTFEDGHRQVVVHRPDLAARARRASWRTTSTTGRPSTPGAHERRTRPGPVDGLGRRRRRSISTRAC